MCMIDGGDPYELYNDRWVMCARKQHKCGECTRIIQVGEQYRATSGLSPYGDGWFSNNVCHHCTFATRWLSVNCGGYVDKGVQEDITYHLEEEIFLGDRSYFAMARVLIGMRRHWKQSGNLMSLPRTIPDLEQTA